MQHLKAHSVLPDFVPRSTSYDGRFGRLFGRLPPWEPPGDTEQLKNEAIERFAINEMFPTQGVRTPEHPELPAGYTYFGQFIDHDITFEPTSSLERQNDPNELKNFRTPRLDLDSIYGRGPKDQPYLYEQLRKDGAIGYLVTGLGASGREPDLARFVQPGGRAVALIGDPRNDENIIVSQLQVAVIRLHNRVLDRVRARQGNADGMAQFHEAQRIVRWFYQYLVWNDFVERIVPPGIWAEALRLEDNGSGFTLGFKSIYDWHANPYIPVEFSAAAYRFGHSLVRDGYQVNIVLQDGKVGTNLERPIFSPPGAAVDDLKGERPLPENHTIQWDWFFALGAPGPDFPQKAGLFDTTLSRAVVKIPDDKVDPKLENPLATLNLKRGWRLQLPSGTAVARAMGFAPIAIDNPMQDSLWVYILREAELTQSGRRLGPVGGTIVAAVLAGLLKGDHMSYVQQSPKWTPDDEPILAEGPRRPNLDHNSSHPARDADPARWTIGDLLKIADMPISGNDIGTRLSPT